MLVEKRGGGTPQPIETEIQTTALPNHKKLDDGKSLLQTYLDDIDVQLDRLSVAKMRSHKIAESLYREEVEPQPVQDQVKIKEGVTPKLKHCIETLVILNNSIEANLNRIANITGE